MSLQSLVTTRTVAGYGYMVSVLALALLSIYIGIFIADKPRQMWSRLFFTAVLSPHNSYRAHSDGSGNSSQRQIALLEKLPMEILCEIAQYMDNCDLVNFSTKLSQTVRHGTKYVYVKRFFTIRRVTTNLGSMLAFLDQCDRGDYVRDIRTLVFCIDTTVWHLWERNMPASISDLWSQRVHQCLVNAHFSSPDNSRHRGISETFQKIPDYRERYKSFADVLRKLPDQMGIWIEPQRSDAGLCHYVISAPQHHLIQDLLDSIGRSDKKIQEFYIGPFMQGRNVFAIAGQTLDPLLLSSQHYSTLRTLSVELSADDWTGFLSVLGQTPCLKHFALTLRDVRDRAIRWTFRSGEILFALGHSPKFSLETLELSKIIAVTQMTFGKVFSAHAQTLRRVSLQDIKLRAPNNALDFFQGLAKANHLQHVGLRRCEPREDVRWIGCLESWQLVYDGIYDKDTACEGGGCGHDSCSGWLYLVRVNMDWSEWIIYEQRGKDDMSVKEMMLDNVSAVRCGIIG